MTSRRAIAWAVTASLMIAGPMIPGPALAEGCDLSRVIGYTLVAQKTIEAYVETGKRTRGFVGCAPERVLIFTDNTALRCQSRGVQLITLPRAWLFARTQTDIKLCVGDDMYDMARAE